MAEDQAKIYPETVEQMSNELETALVEFEQAREKAEQAIREYEAQPGMELAGILDRAMMKLEEAHTKLTNVVQLLVADARRFAVVVGILKRHVKRLGI